MTFFWILMRKMWCYLWFQFQNRYGNFMIRIWRFFLDISIFFSFFQMLLQDVRLKALSLDTNTKYCTFAVIFRFGKWQDFVKCWKLHIRTLTVIFTSFRLDFAIASYWTFLMLNRFLRVQILKWLISMEEQNFWMHFLQN